MSKHAPPPSAAAPTSKSPKSSSRHFGAGLASGLASAVLLQPADLLKTRQQQAGDRLSLPQTIRALLRPGAGSRSNGGVGTEVAGKVGGNGADVGGKGGSGSSGGGLLALWRGTLPSALRTGLGSALYFTALNAIRKVQASTVTVTAVAAPASVPASAPAASAPFADSASASTSNHRAQLPTTATTTTPTTTTRTTMHTAPPTASPTANLVAGSAARLMAGMVLMPVTVVKVRFESSLYADRSVGGAAAAVVRTHGIRGLFAGFGATAVRDGPYAGLYVVFYEGLKGWLSRVSQIRGRGGGETERGQRTQMAAATATTTPAAVNFVSGAAAAAAATAITNPFDVLKTRLQLQPERYGHMARAARLVLAEDGVRGLVSGLGLRVVRKALSSAIAWTVYEELVR